MANRPMKIVLETTDTSLMLALIDWLAKQDCEPDSTVLRVPTDRTRGERIEQAARACQKYVWDALKNADHVPLGMFDGYDPYRKLIAEALGDSD